MSVSARVFTGFYIQLTTKNLFKKINIHACANENCSEYDEETKNNFCGKCGSKIEIVEATQKINVTSSYDIAPEEYGDDFTFNKGTLSLMPSCYVNKKIVPYSQSKDIMYEEEQLAFDLLTIQKTLEELKKKSILADVAEYINNEFGKGTAEIVFGVVAYAS